jgi:hypothetical protein
MGHAANVWRLEHLLSQSKLGLRGAELVAGVQLMLVAIATALLRIE